MFETLVVKVLSVTDQHQELISGINKENLAAFFLAQNEIRSFVTNTNGFGHQVSTVNIMLRIIGYGYNKNITCIYDDGPADLPTIEKLALLLPEIVLKTAGPPDPITINGATISFQPTSSYAPAEQIEFGITGGYDDKTNLSTKYLTNNFVVLQPFQWGKAYYGNSILTGATTLSLDQLQAIGPNFGNRGFYMSDPTLTDQQWDLYMDNPKVAIRSEQANYIYSLATNESPKYKNINLCSAYGMSDAYNGLTTLATTAPNLLFNLALSMLYVQKNGTNSLKTRAVLLVLANVKDESYKVLKNYFLGKNTDGGSFTNPELLKFLNDYNVSRNAKIITSLAGDALTKAIDALQDGQVLVASLPGLPPPVFNQMMYASNLPFVFEGKNTANLAINFANPYYYLATAGSGVVYPTLPLNADAPDPDALSIQAIANSMQDGPLLWPANNDPSSPIKLGDFTIQTKDPQNEYPKYFNRTQEFYHDELNDKLLLSLFVFINTHN
ncbi:hypothetical protein [Flavobacterium collinsii]|uniref:Uncharacterized protein n=1 Tax=Flavobacterium collinsii TaxID=1114861 RepID=A0A9W4TJE8_9FLAO|nr:hypothetical protein [Flavobacterium collinsii]CAI2767064.1 conserved protein of unknown function [Flavobacterium collinsii]